MVCCIRIMRRIEEIFGELLRRIQPRRLVCIGCLGIAMSTASCLDGGSDNTPSAPKEFRGTWIGSTGDGQPMELVLSQLLASVDGTAQVGDQDGAITGSIDGTRIEATIQNVPPRILVGSLRGETTMTGSLRDLSGGILSSFTVNLVSR